MNKVSLITPEERSIIAQNIQSRIDELTFEELANQSNQMKKEELLKIKQTLQDYLIRYKQTEIIINTTMQKYDLSSDIRERSYQLYGIYKSLMNIDIQNLLQDGYILIETLRKTFTGKEIQYQIGMEYSIGKNKSELINKMISLAELLSFAHVDINWGQEGMMGFKLRAKSYKSDFFKEYEKQKEFIESLIVGLHSLYPKVKETLYYAKNKGNVYEVYQQLKYEGWADHSPKSKNPKNLKASAIVDKYLEVKRGTQSFVSGGDYGDTQAKLLSAAPSIATLGTIGNALKLILTYIEQGTNANITIKNIKENVFSANFDKLMREGLNDMLLDVDEELSAHFDEV